MNRQRLVTASLLVLAACIVGNLGRLHVAAADVNSCICGAVAAHLNPTQAGGKWTVTTSEDAIDDFADAARSCIGTTAKTATIDCGEYTIQVDIKPAGGGDASVTGSTADIAIAIGGHGTPNPDQGSSTGSDGGSATASTSSAPAHDDGAAVADGGNGTPARNDPDGPENPQTPELGSPNKGGAGKATAKGGSAGATGGDGSTGAEAGGIGGDAEAETSGAGTADANGGAGGDPEDDTTAGGNGGAAQATATGGLASSPGASGESGDPGTHGRGATATANGTSASSENGGTTENTTP